MNVGQAALGRRVEVLAGTVPVGDGLLDLGFGRADTVVRGSVGDEVVGGVPKAEAHWRRSISRFVADLGDDRVGIDGGGIEVVHDSAAWRRAVLPRAIRLVAEGRLDPETWVSHRIGLDGVPEALDMLANYRDRALKVVVQPD